MDNPDSQFNNPEIDTTQDPPPIPSSFTTPWSTALTSSASPSFPDYHQTPHPFTDLSAPCTPLSITTGTGAAIFTSTLLPALLSARREIILVTCFWAASPTLTALSASLTALAARRSAASPRLRIALCFSSSGVLQKLRHPQTTRGRTYAPHEWPALGLPTKSVLDAAGIVLSVRSLFFLPFSVMHPKYVIVDRCRAWLPSCNVSWEAWFETCLAVEGEIVDRLFEYYRHVWDVQDAASPSHFPLPPLEPGETENEPDSRQAAESTPSPCTSRNQLIFAPGTRCSALLLPSSHHTNPHFRPWPLAAPPPPTTPLNAALLTLFATAQRHIEILSPNVTSEPAVGALLGALGRGVHVTLRTSRNMMLVEQLVTAGTTTAWTLGSLIRRYEALCAQRDKEDEEFGGLAVGRLEVFYYKPLAESDDEEEPVLAHAKVVLVDDEYVVLGSGNMDRASWYTSQELGLLLYKPGFRGAVWQKPLETRQEPIYP
ncbi:hypothetical protein TD95_005305 [Thielaviopsis punctulata]|uniref:PLD phosphodiesterase domain-containing protein n=1 Tax=Thielaviopsis punctulata TaxID=72032 RepID=A0A0F4ZJQ0_9PEZI|nr:hypothetical protein TD95_005305 [Thielaviopsis punctulata]